MWYQYCANYLKKINNMRYVTNAVCHSLSFEHAGFRFTIAVQDCGSWTVAYKSAFSWSLAGYADLHVSCAELLQKPSENKDIPLLFTTPAGQRQGVVYREKPP